MGISIHMHIEVKKDGRWLHFAAPAMLRDRDFFGLVAGTTEGIRPVSAPKGLPEDMSEVTLVALAQDKDRYKIHHATWLGPDELVRLQECLADRYGGPGKNPMDYDLEGHYLNTYIAGNAIARHEGWDDVRLIAWFDN